MVRSGPRSGGDGNANTGGIAMFYKIGCLENNRKFESNMLIRLNWIIAFLKCMQTCQIIQLITTIT